MYNFYNICSFISFFIGRQLDEAMDINVKSALKLTQLATKSLEKSPLKVSYSQKGILVSSNLPKWTKGFLPQPLKWVKSKKILNTHYYTRGKHATVLLYWEREYKQAQLPLNSTSHFLISHLVGHLLVFIKISLAPPMIKIDNFS